MLSLNSSHDVKSGSRGAETPRSYWSRIRLSEQFYSRALRSIAKQAGQFIIELWQAGREDAIQETMHNYANVLEPWAKSVSEKMLADVTRRDAQAWIKQSKRMAAAMQQELRTMPMGEIVTQLRNEQVALIKSIPIDAAQRAQNLAFEAASQTSARAKTIAQQIMNTTQVTESRATLIARTEIARSHAIIQEARARWIGAETYTWHTLLDAQVRHDHKDLEGQVFRFDDPPIADKRNNVKANPGCIYNCRCFAVPNLPAKYQPRNRYEQ